MNRYFRIPSDESYEALRRQLDAAFGHVPPTTCVDPAAVAPRDTQGRILLAVRHEFVAFDAVAAILPQLLASGAVEEIEAGEYQPVAPPMP